MPHRVRAPASLLEVLEEMFRGRSRRDLRRLIQEERVLVNGEVARDPARPLSEGDAVDCARFGRAIELHALVRLLYEDEHLLAVEKGPGILTAEGVRGRDPTVVDVLERYLKARGIRSRVFACHRLDREVSGVCLFARHPAVAAGVRDPDRKHLRERVYHALVEGVPVEREGTIRSHLRDDDATKTVSVVPEGEGKLCLTHYRVLEAGPTHATLEVRLETGRKNQIRVQLAALGHPIAGDAKYGARSNPARRVALHATRLVVVHPVTGERLELFCPVPAGFASPPRAREGEAASGARRSHVPFGRNSPRAGSVPGGPRRRPGRRR